MTLLVSSRQKALGAYVVTLTGELNGKTYPALENKLDQLLEERPTVIVLDMAEVNYLSSAGIRVILKTKKMLTAYNGRLVFMNLQPQIKIGLGRFQRLQHGVIVMGRGAHVNDQEHHEMAPDRTGLYIHDVHIQVTEHLGHAMHKSRLVFADGGNNIKIAHLGSVVPLR